MIFSKAINKLRYYKFFKNNKYFYFEYFKNVIRGMMKKPTLVSAELFFETRCNFQCWHCSSSNYINNIKTMDVNDIEVILKKLKKVGTVSVCLVGGEPTCNKDLDKIIRLCCEYRLLPTIITNGWLLNEKDIDKLFEEGLANMGFSIQSFRQKEHDVLVNKQGAYTKSIKNINYCISKKYPCSICAVPTNENLANGDFRSIIDFALNNKIRVNVNLPAATGKLRKDLSSLLTVESIKIFEEEFLNIDNIIPDFKVISTKQKYYCPMGDKGIYILPDGQVCPCTFVHISYGNILTDSIEEILIKMKNAKLIKDMDRNQCPIAMDRDFIDKVNSIMDKDEVAKKSRVSK